MVERVPGSNRSTLTLACRPPCSVVGTVLTTAAPGRCVVTQGPLLENSATVLPSGFNAPTLVTGAAPAGSTGDPTSAAKAAGKKGMRVPSLPAASTTATPFAA